MSGASLNVVDGAGRTIEAAIVDQPLRVRLELDIDPKSAPDEIVIDIVRANGVKESMRAERIDWGADQPLYQSELVVLDDVFGDPVDDALGIVFDEALDVVSDAAFSRDPASGEYLRFEYEGLTADVQSFDSSLDARYWFTQAELSDRIGATTTTAINLTDALRKVRAYPESVERSTLETQIEGRLNAARAYLHVLDRAKSSLHNQNYWAEQQIRAAQHYMGKRSIREAGDIGSVLQAAQETVTGHIVGGVATITLGGYQMLVQSTGVAQVRTMVTGEDEMGKAVSFDGRVTAFLDLVADGALQGAGMKFQLDTLISPTTLHTADTRVRYTGPKPEDLAPELSIVDPSMMGMPPQAIKAAFRAARMTDSIPLVRPTNPEALVHLSDGQLPKPEAFKAKTVNELDTLLGMQPENRGLVGIFDPETTFFETALRGGGMSEADIAAQMDLLRGGTVIAAPQSYAGADLWTATAKRFIQRSEEIKGSTGYATNKLVEKGDIRIEDGLIVDAASGKHFTGDHDLYDFIDSLGGPVSPAMYQRLVSYLESSPFRAQHGAHNWWNPQRSDFPAGAEYDAKFATYRGIYEKIIDSHKKERTVKHTVDGKEVEEIVRGEILIAFPPVGPPIAVFAGTVPGPYLGHMPGPWAPSSQGSSFLLPSEVQLLGITGTVVRPLGYDDSVTDWIAADSEFRETMEQAEAEGTEEQFEAQFAASAAAAAQLDAELGSDDETDFDGDELDGGVATDGYQADVEGNAEALDSAMQEAAQGGRSGSYTQAPKTPSRTTLLVGAGTLAVILIGLTVFLMAGGSPAPVEEVLSTTPLVAAVVDAGCEDSSDCTEEEVEVIEEAIDDMECTAGSDCDLEDVEELIEVLRNCPDGLQVNKAKYEDSTGDAIADQEQADRAASDVECTGYATGSHIFTMVVVGDGEELSTAERTRWYNPRFVVNVDPDTGQFVDGVGFSVDVRWNPDGSPDARIMSASFETVPDAAIDVEWMDESTLVVTADIPDVEVIVTRFHIELSVRTEDADGNITGNYGDLAVWELES